ncbi:hypothetical protein [Microbacterium sp. NPDC057658]|uniref:hypothetical protein n=1 Tax=unclassified Microbacterium TaxID=2609290 RepID=UPI00366CE719
MTTTSRRSHRAKLIADLADPTVFAADAETPEVDYRPAVPARVRDAVYWTTLGVAAASALVSGVAGVWFPDLAPQVLATGGVLTGVMGIVGGGVGVVYRPGAGR